RVWDEVHSCVQRGGTFFVLRPAPGGAGLLPIPAWKLRALTCQELAELLAGPQPGGEPLPDDVQHGAPIRRRSTSPPPCAQAPVAAQPISSASGSVRLMSRVKMGRVKGQLLLSF
ncbi:MAG: hypothetical protein SGPRY_005607, partial [Prymnesium sp.]